MYVFDILHLHEALHALRLFAENTSLYFSAAQVWMLVVSVVLRSEVTYQDGDKLGVRICTAPISYGGVFEQ